MTETTEAGVGSDIAADSLEDIARPRHHLGLRSLASAGHAREFFQSQGLLVALFSLIVFFSIKSPYFFTSTNLITIATGAVALGMMATTQTSLMIAGGFDVSVGSVVALSAVVLGILIDHDIPGVVAILLVLLLGVAVGAINGFIVVTLGVNPLIATLGTLSIFSGLAFLLSSGQTQVVTNGALSWLTDSKAGPLPVSVVILLAIFVAAIVVERRTVTGRYIYAIGGNFEAARLAGVRTSLLPFLLYVASALSAAAAGVIITAVLGSASPQVGAVYNLSVVTAVILGGTSLAGGRGTIVGTVIGVAILEVLSNGFALLLLPSYVQTIALGVALIVAVLIDQTARRMER